MKISVFVDLDGYTLSAGHLLAESKRGRLTSAFAYDNGYLSNPQSYPIDPALPLTQGAWPSASALPRAIRDTAPDRWGRNLINRRVAAEALAAGQPIRTLTELDYLLGVSDASRQGALRFKRADSGSFEYPGDDVPKLVALPTLVNAAHAVAVDAIHAEAAVKMLLELGSASLGGARPKASVRDGEHMMIAKFARPQDDWRVMAWEKTVLDLAQATGIATPERRLLVVNGSDVLLVNRFDRSPDGRRTGYISAMTLCEADDGDRRDYLDMAERLAAVSAAPQADLEQLWRRVALGIAINNVDDHLRNHGLIRVRSGWRLSPVFDINPDPEANAQHATSIGGAVTVGEAAQALVRSSAAFGLSDGQAVAILQDVIRVVREWRAVATRNGVHPSEQEGFAPIFERGVTVLNDAMS